VREEPHTLIITQPQAVAHLLCLPTFSPFMIVNETSLSRIVNKTFFIVNKTSLSHTACTAPLLV
jgi:hypothetical protein